MDEKRFSTKTTFLPNIFSKKRLIVMTGLIASAYNFNSYGTLHDLDHIVGFTTTYAIRAYDL
jgi:hypothetical protein